MSRATAGAEHPHAPRVGRLARLLGPLKVTGVFWYRFHRFGIVILPNWAKVPIVALFTVCFFFLLRNVRAAIASNLIVVLGPCGWWGKQRRIWRTLFTFAWCLTERYERLSTDDEFTITTENLEAWSAANDGGSGCILVTGHVGNWEIGSALPSDREKRRVHVVREEELDPQSQAFIAGLLRERMGELYVTHFASDDMSLGITLLQALRDGDVVALQADRPRKGGRTVTTALFDRPFDLPVGPIVLARTAQVPILPVFVIREKRFRYRLVLREPIRVADTGDRDADTQAAAAEIAKSLEWAIRNHPHQWFCFGKVWKHSVVKEPRASGKL